MQEKHFWEDIYIYGVQILVKIKKIVVILVISHRFYHCVSFSAL